MPLKLTVDNYYSNEANREYMSNSRFQGYRSCEAMQYAKDFEGWIEPVKPNDVDHVGNYFHAASEGPESLQRYIDFHPEIISSQGPTKGQLKAEFRKANEMIYVFQNDPICRYALTGEKEVIQTANWLGIPWKIRIDNLNRDKGFMADLKSCKDLYHGEWSDRERRWVHFIELYGYLKQFALYSQINMLADGRDYWLDFLGVFITKQDKPAKRVIGFDPTTLLDHLAYVEKGLPRVLAVISGEAKPRRCERCIYCRETSMLGMIQDYDQFIEEDIMGIRVDY